MCATSVIKKVPKVDNHPLGENSPNLATLIKYFNDSDAYFRTYL